MGETRREMRRRAQGAELRAQGTERRAQEKR